MELVDRDKLTLIGLVGQPHGIRGDLKVFPQTDQPAFYEACKSIYLATREGLKRYQVKRLKIQDRHWLLSLEGVMDRNSAEALKGAELLIEDTQLAPLGEMEYFRHDLVGCRMETMEGETLGEVTGIIETGANDVLVVEKGAESLMVPMTREVIGKVDIESRIIRIHPLPGLLDDDEAE